MPNPRTPTVIKSITGAARPDRANPREPQSPALSVGVKPPVWVESSDARRAWSTLIQIAPPGLITQMDAMMLGLLVDAFGDWLEARRVLKHEGRYYRTVGKDGSEMIRAHPATADETDAFRRVRLILKDFGMDPADRARVSAGEQGETDPIETFLGRRTG